MSEHDDDQTRDTIADFLDTATGAGTGLEAARAEIAADLERLKLESVDGLAVDDYAFVRLQLRGAIERYGELIPGLVRVTNASESPQQYGAAASFFKTFGDLNETLLDTAVKVKRVGNATGKGLPAPGKPTTPDVSETPAPQGVENLTDPVDYLEQLVMQKKREVVVVEVAK